MDDETSIITQVSKENDDQQPLRDLSSESNCDIERDQTNRKKKHQHHKLLASIFCCFSGAFTRRPPRDSTEDRSCLSNCDQKFLLPPLKDADGKKKCVIIDLDETLVHSSFKPVKNADYIVPVEIDNLVHTVYVLKRPHIDKFLQRMGQLFECVLFTASVSKYAEPVSNLLDKWNVFDGKLYRESCVYNRGFYVKDLSKLGRDLKSTVILDNSPTSYAFHPENAVPIRSWFDDPYDTELLDLIPFFERLAEADDVRHYLRESPRCNPNLIMSSPLHNLQGNQPGIITQESNFNDQDQYESHEIEHNADETTEEVSAMNKIVVENTANETSEPTLQELNQTASSHGTTDDLQSNYDHNGQSVKTVTVNFDESTLSVTSPMVLEVENSVNGDVSPSSNSIPSSNNGNVDHNLLT